MCRQIGHSIRYCCLTIRFYNSPAWNSIIFFWFLPLSHSVFFHCICHSVFVIPMLSITQPDTMATFMLFMDPLVTILAIVCSHLISHHRHILTLLHPLQLLLLLFSFSVFILLICLFVLLFLVISMVRKGWSIVLFREENTDCCRRKHFWAGEGRHGYIPSTHRTNFMMKEIRYGITVKIIRVELKIEHSHLSTVCS